MTQVFGNAEEIERFAHALNAFLDEVQAAQGGIDHAFQALGDSWQDTKRAQFEEEYLTLRQHLIQFDASAREQVPYLVTLAARLREYLTA